MARPLFGHTLYFKDEGPAVSRQTLGAATDTILPAEIVWLTNGTGGGLTMTSAPTIPDGRDGQRCLLVNIAAQPITVQDQGTLANSNLRLSAATIALGTRDSLWLIYSADIADWVQIGTTNVI